MDIFFTQELNYYFFCFFSKTIKVRDVESVLINSLSKSRLDGPVITSSSQFDFSHENSFAHTVHGRETHQIRPLHSQAEQSAGQARTATLPVAPNKSSLKRRKWKKTKFPS
ncbi:unnamed protein product [Meganyctiphanes norvegica]|uniref:Uncharacterized protein n=1 Tax=Meganyctiphanes norvegica TaxID=48144 RepID=A0AAV2SNF6_MEGNR